MTLNDRDRQWLLAVARTAIEAHVRGVATAPMSHPDAESGLTHLDAPYGGVFVSLHRGDSLRGCIGTLDGRDDLEDAVAHAAVAACTSDPRFSPVSLAELPDLAIEISVLSQVEPVADLETIEVGRHGLIAERGARRGLLLPQVARQWGWTRHQFLAQTCHKAGLPEDAWKNGARISRFTADVFSEPAGQDSAGPRA